VQYEINYPEAYWKKILFPHLHISTLLQTPPSPSLLPYLFPARLTLNITPSPHKATSFPGETRYQFLPFFKKITTTHGFAIRNTIFEYVHTYEYIVG